MELKTELFRQNASTQCIRITGFSENELSELNSMDYREMKETIIDMLDRRNDKLGSRWVGRGFLSAWINNGAVFVEIRD